MNPPAPKPASAKRRIYALSIKQPWAALLIAGKKSIEVRSWYSAVRGRIFIHAAKIADDRPEAWQWVTDEMRPLTELAGGIIGEMELFAVKAYRNQASFNADRLQHLNEPEWFQPKGLYGFQFRNPKTLPFRPYSGNVRFFTVEDEA